MRNGIIKLFGITSCLIFSIAGVGDSHAPANSDVVLGFGFLKRIPGLWSGPVSSTTPAGNFPVWYVDFRPVSPGQVAQYSTLDADTLNYISFFIVKHDNQLKVAMRTEGFFKNKGCVTYEVIDTVKEPEGYYRFSDFQSGDKRAYTEFTFKNDNALVMEVYTSKFNKVFPLLLHSRWEARRAGGEAASDAVSHFSFPQAVMIKDFSHVFDGMFESVYFTFERDPYPSSTQPYVGKAVVDIGIDKKIRLKGNYEILILLTTESLFKGLLFKSDRLKYISRLARLPIGTKTFTFNNVHPGRYHVYSYIDVNNDRLYLSGDYMSADLKNTVEVKAEESVTVKTMIDFRIP